MKTPEQNINEGKTVRFVYHEHSNREPVDLFIAKHKLFGQNDLGLFVEPTIWVWKPKQK